MAKIVVARNQQEEIRRRFPKPAYSRIVGITIPLPADGAWYYNYTDNIGDRVWLLKVKILIGPKAVDMTKYTGFIMCAGGRKPTTIADIARWDIIAPCKDVNRQPLIWTMHDGRNEMEFEFMKLYTGRHIRFAVMATRNVGTIADGLWAQFTISEG